ncbi:hypothetical protein BKA81DRAFT_112320 [Phyllosticta paracitricarpa]
MVRPLNVLACFICRGFFSLATKVLSLHTFRNHDVHGRTSLFCHSPSAHESFPPQEIRLALFSHGVPEPTQAAATQLSSHCSKDEDWPRTIIHARAYHPTKSTTR